jgi:hypothetical protein
MFWPPRPEPPRYDDDDAVPLAHAYDGLHQRRLALRIEIGARLIEHHQEGLAVKGPGERNPLALPG